MVNDVDRTRGMFSEVKGEIIKINLIYSFLDTLMVFSLLYFIVSFFDIKLLFALLIPGLLSVIFFSINFGARLKKSKLKDMEDANPQLREILRTAHDNQDQNNFMVTALFDELKGKMRTASSGKLMDPKRIITRVISAIAIVFFIVFLSSVTINLKKIEIPYDKLNFLRDKGDDRVNQEGEITDLVFNQTNTIYGDASIAKLGNDVVKINVNPTMSDIDLTKTGDAEDEELRSGAIPDEIGISSSAYNNQKILEEAEAAVNYSQRISKIG